MWMATIDFRDGGHDFGNEIVLKIWRWLPGVVNGGSGSWILNTRIDRPHDQERVTTLHFSPSKLQDDDVGDESSSSSFVLLTADESGVLRTWKPRMVRDEKNSEDDVFWVARSSFSYRNQRASNALWSPDASLIAVAHGPSVTIWEPLTNTMLGNLTTPAVATVSTVCFLGQSGRYLATVSRKCDVVLWDLVTRSIVWAHRVPYQGPILMISHPENDSFAIIGTDSTAQCAGPSRSWVKIFGTHSSHILRSYSLPFVLRQAIWYPSTTASLSSKDGLETVPPYTLLAITSDSTTVLIGDEENIAVTQSVGSSARAIGANATEESKPTLFQDIFGSSAFDTLEASFTATTSRLASSEIASLPSGTRGLDLTLLDGPAHMLPPIGSLFDSLINCFTKATTSPISSVQPLASHEGLEEGEKNGNTEVDGDWRTKKNREMGSANATYGVRKIDEEEISVFTELFRTVLNGKYIYHFVETSFAYT